MFLPSEFILSDSKSLDQYLTGISPDCDKIKSNLFISLRNTNRKLPDHFYKNLIQNDYLNIKDFTDLFVKSFENISSKYLVTNTVNNEVFVRSELFAEWQNALTYFPPAIIISNKIANIDFDFTDIDNLHQNYIIPNILFTAISSVNVEEFKKKNTTSVGFIDLHIHLNGSTETDNVWQDFLSFPRKAYKNLKQAQKDLKVVEHYEQEFHNVEPYKFYKLILGASRIRNLLFDLLVKSNSKKISNNLNFEKIISSVFSQNYDFSTFSSNNPFSLLIKNKSNSSTISIESLMYVLIFKELKSDSENRNIISRLFHIYLLILGSVHKMMVQQEHQYGFDQFQKLTLNSLRDLSEEKYEQRFLQIAGNKLQNLSFLEGRMAPKNSELQNILLIKNIIQGWENFIKAHKNLHGISQNKPEFKLVAHFIKSKDDFKSDWIRHKTLRINLFKKSYILSCLIKKNKFKDLIVGIDAASNELHTPPEVFAPIFRRMRRVNSHIKFTFHVGEDFVHPLSGLRAIYEALLFLNLKPGDRLGHVTAAGISWELWKKEFEKTILIKQGEWLDNLIFLYSLISTNELSLLMQHKIHFQQEIQKLLSLIYNDNFNIEDYQLSWRYRTYCPIHLLNLDNLNANSLTVFDDYEWNDVNKLKSNTNAIKCLQAYHSMVNRKNYDKLIPINIDEIFKAPIIDEIQIHILKLLSQADVVIETLPTSNVRISQYKDHSEHHLFRWKKWYDEGKEIPKIVIGSDDTGIFSTNIFNEYAHIYCQLTSENNTNRLTPNKAIKYLEELNTNSLKYKFT